LILFDAKERLVSRNDIIDSSRCGKAQELVIVRIIANLPVEWQRVSSCWLHTYLNMPILTHLTKFISMAEMAKARGAFISNPGSAMKYRRTGT
jgi:hypothetical protein